MPLKLNVGLSRKVGEANFGSRGASINVEVEVESALGNEPAKLKERLRQIFGLVRDALAEELNGKGSGNGVAANNGHNHQAQAPAAGGNTAAAPKPATQSQLRAIAAIARRLSLNLNELLRNRFRVRQPQDLSIKQASELIDLLKTSNP